MRKMDGDSVDSIASKLEDLLVEDNDGDGSAAESPLRTDDVDAPHHRQHGANVGCGEQRFVMGLVDMAGEVLR